MPEDDDISFERPQDWLVFKLNIGDKLPAGMHIDIYRFQRGSGESLTGPTLIDISSSESTSQAKILFGEEPLVLIDQPTPQQREALLQTMVAVAKVLNDEEMDAGLFDADQARLRAAALVRSMLPKSMEIHDSD